MPSWPVSSITGFLPFPALQQKISRSRVACVLRLILIRSGCRDKQQSQFRSASFLLTPPHPTPPPPSSLSYLQITLHGHVYLHDNGASMPSQAITLSGLPFTGIDRTNAITTYLHVRSQTAVKLPPPPSLSPHMQTYACAQAPPHPHPPTHTRKYASALTSMPTR